MEGLALLMLPEMKFSHLCSVWMTPSHVLMRESAFHIKMVQDIATVDGSMLLKQLPLNIL
ncbi:hypothetical protein EK904_011603 [Melospiza melodia maxima]|nr:hypothetical protein EK904_011603 [Melospiza melodia maxima]